MKKITVIIPCYNVEQLIDRCLLSITQQTIGLDYLEIICVNDSSTDTTLQKLEIWEEKYPTSIQVLDCKTNNRQGTARNIGLEHASTDWISFIDSDDWIEPDYYEKLYNAAVENQCEVVMCQKKRDFSNTLSYFDTKNTENKNQLIHINSISDRKQFIHSAMMGSYAWGKLIQKKVLIDNDIYFPEMLAYEDGFWGILMHCYVKKLFILEEYLYHYYTNYNSTILQKNAMYHIDLLTVQLQLWAELKNRNLLNLYKEELEYEFLISCYLGFLKILALRFDKPPYSFYLLLKECVNERIPDYTTNKYIIARDLPNHLLIMLESLSLPLTSNDFDQFIKQVQLLNI